MTKGGSIAAFVIVGIILGAVLYNARGPNEPMYQGRGINDWLRKLNSAISHDELQSRDEAENAVQATGAKAAPYIVAHLRKSNSAWSKTHRNLFPKLPAWLQRLIPSPREEFTISTGSSAFFAIGAPAKPALITALQDENPAVRSASALTLGSLAHYKGTDLRDAVPALTECLRVADPDVRCLSATTLGYLGLDAAPAVPGLIALLTASEVGSQKGRRASASVSPHYLHNGNTKLPAILDCAMCPTWEALPRFGSFKIVRTLARPSTRPSATR